eukprot:NODE_18091_length_911_cov_1.994898.p1 GENE.NODE_18091_length_911_cov_1.994898~~NODE_18091_length_911_cov_1.994898.p1  ORF type:complete len:184 (-),score=34.55 NODE_18091_length_911_cov_1.994898:358-876(-)
MCVWGCGAAAWEPHNGSNSARPPPIAWNDGRLPTPPAAHRAMRGVAASWVQHPANARRCPVLAPSPRRRMSTHSPAAHHPRAPRPSTPQPSSSSRGGAMCACGSAATAAAATGPPASPPQLLAAVPGLMRASLVAEWVGLVPARDVLNFARDAEVRRGRPSPRVEQLASAGV